MEITNSERETLICLIENEIEGDVDVISDTNDEKEKEFWKEAILDLKNLLIKLKPIEITI